jgi:hypothetical protein
VVTIVALFVELDDTVAAANGRLIPRDERVTLATAHQLPVVAERFERATRTTTVVRIVVVVVALLSGFHGAVAAGWRVRRCVGQAVFRGARNNRNLSGVWRGAGYRFAAGHGEHAEGQHGTSGARRPTKQVTQGEQHDVVLLLQQGGAS